MLTTLMLWAVWLEGPLIAIENIPNKGCKWVSLKLLKYFWNHCENADILRLLTNNIFEEIEEKYATKM